MPPDRVTWQHCCKTSFLHLRRSSKIRKFVCLLAFFGLIKYLRINYNSETTKVCCKYLTILKIFLSSKHLRLIFHRVSDKEGQFGKQMNQEIYQEWTPASMLLNFFLRHWRHAIATAFVYCECLVLVLIFVNKAGTWRCLTLESLTNARLAWKLLSRGKRTGLRWPIMSDKDKVLFNLTPKRRRASGATWSWRGRSYRDCSLKFRAFISKIGSMLVWKLPLI